METATPDLLRSCLDHVNEAFYVVELSSGEIIDVNQRACEMHGYSREELIGLTPPDISETFPDTVSWTQHIEEVKKQGRISLYTNHVHRDGHRIPVDVDVEYVEMDDAEYLLASACEITDTELDENPRYKSHARYSSVFQHAPIGLWEEDFSGVKQTIDDLRADGVEKFEEYFREHPEVLDECIGDIRVVNVNPRAIDLYDAPDEEALREHFRQTIKSDYRENMKDQLVQLARGRGTIEQTGKTKTVDGEEIEVRLKMVVPPGHRDDWGQVFVSVEDISEVVQAKQALKRSEKRYRSIFENTAVGIATTDPEGRILNVNPSFADMLGYDVDQLESKHIKQFVHENDREQCELQIPELLDQEHDQLDFETRFETRAGDVIWVYQSNTVVRDDRGDPDYLLMITREITEQKRARDKFESLVENAPVAIAGLDEDGRVVDWNPAAKDMFGWTKEEVSGKPLPNVPENRETEHEEVLTDIFSEEPVKTVETVRRHKDGSEIPVLLSTAHYPVKGEGSEGAVGMYVDISEQHEIRDELEQREQRLRSLISSVPGIVYRCLLDECWTMKFISENVKNVTGYDAETFVDNRDRSYADIIHPEDRRRVLELVETAVSNNEPFEVEYRIIHQSGEVRWVFERGQAIHDEENVEFLHGVILDITERKQAQEELKEREQLLESLVSRVPGTVYREDVSDGFSNPSMEFISESVEEDFGYPPEKFIADEDAVTFSELIHPGDRDRVMDTVRDAVERGVSFETEYRVRRNDGEVKWVFERADVIEHGADEKYLHGLMIDVTDRVEAQKALERSERGLREFHRITTDADLDFEEQVRRVLKLACDRLNMDTGLVTALTDDGDLSIERAWGDHADHLADEVLSLDVTHCRETIESKGLHVVHDAIKEDVEVGGEAQPSFASYIGSRVIVDDQIHGTVCFEGVESHEDTFTQHDQNFVRMIAHWLGFEEQRRRTQRRLERSEQRFRSTFEQAAVGIGHVDPDGSFRRVNEKFCSLLGYSEDELMELDFQTLTHPDDLERDIEHVERLLEGKDDQYSIEKRYFRKDDSILWARLTVGIVRREEDSDYFVSVIEDITDRKRAERELAESERQFRQLAENIEGVFWLVDPDSEEVLYVSPAYEDIWGRPREELYEDWERMKDPIHPDDRAKLDEALPVDKDTNFELEYRIRQPGGEIRWIRDRAFPVQNEAGEVVRVAGIAEDITERKKLRRERDQFFSLSLDMVCVSDMEGNFRDINPAFTDILGYSRDTLMSKPFLEFVHPDDREDTRKVMERLEQGEDVYGFENRYLTKDDEVRWFSWNSASFGDRIYAVARDITDERQYRKQLEKALEEKEILLEEVHHRVKNNLQVIISLLDMQSRQIDDAETHEAFNESVSRIRSMALIHEKLYETGTLENVDLSQYLEELCEYLMQSRSRPGQKYTTTIESVTLPLEKAIPLGMIVNELVSNALEHGMGSDTGRVTVDFTRTNGRAELVVSDDGPGLSDDVDPMTATTMGMKIIRALTEHELEGNLAFIEDDGLTVKAEIPV